MNNKNRKNSRKNNNNVLITIMKKKSETRMTSSVLKQDPNAQKVKRNAIYYDKTQHANFRGKPLFQTEKNEM